MSTTTDHSTADPAATDPTAPNATASAPSGAGAEPAAVQPGGQLDPTVVALGRAVQRALRRIESVDKNVIQLAADVTALGTRLAPPPPAGPVGPGGSEDDAGDGPPAVRSWLLAVDVEQAVADLADLVGWVERVYLRYSRAHLSSCWLWHPEVVEELWWLRGAHADAYDPEDGSWLRVGDWHDRQRPGVQQRVNGLLGKCSLSRHTDRNGRPAEVAEPAPPPLGAHHAAVAVAWTATRTAGPAPTAALLGEAEQSEYAQHRSHR